MRAAKRRLAMRVAAILGGLVIGLVLFEAFAQFAGAVRELAESGKGAEGPRQAAPHAYQPAPWYHRYPSVAVAMHTVLVPFSEDFGHFGRHNSQGFRSPEYTTAHPPGVFRIVCVGDSFTYGWGVRAPETFPPALERLFARDGKKHPPVEVINIGIAGSRPTDNFVRLLAHGESLAPDLVIFQLQSNDLEYSLLCPYVDFFGEYFFNQDHRGGLENWLTTKTVLGGKMRKAEEKKYAHALLVSEEKRMIRPDSFELRFYREVLEALAEWRKRTGVPVLFLSFPLMDSNPRGNNFKNYTEPNQANANLERMAAIAKTYGFPLVNMIEVLRQKAAGRYMAVSEHDGHPNPLSHELAAEALHDAITRVLFPKGLPTPRPAGPKWAQELSMRQKAARSWPFYNQNLAPQKAFFTELHRLYPESPWITFQLAFVLEYLGDLKESRRLYESLAQLAPGLAAPWYYAGHRLPDPEREAYLKKMLAILPDDTFSLSELAHMYGWQHRKEESCRAYTELARHPGFLGNFSAAVAALKDLGCYDPNAIKISDFQGRGDLAGAYGPAPPSPKR